MSFFDHIRKAINSLSNTNPTSQKSFKWFLLAALVLFVVTVLVFLFGGSSFSERNFTVEVKGPQQALSGDEVTYTLSYKNGTNVDITDAKFRFFYPEESVVIRDGAFTHDSSEELSIAKIKAGQSGEKEFKVFLIGDKGNIKNAHVELIYHAGTIRSTFRKTASINTTIVALPIPLTLVAPPSAVNGQPISYILDYRNESKVDVADLQLEFTYPDGFSVTRTNPNPEQGNNVWKSDLLKDGQGSRITISGILTGNERETKEISVVLKRKIGDEYIDYEKATSSTILSSPLLGISVLANGSQNYSAVVGDSINYSLQYRNNSNFNLVGLTLDAKLEGDMFDISSLDTNGGFYDSRTGIITWNSGSIGQFSNLAPGQSGKVDFKIRLKPSFLGDSLGSKNFFVKTTASLSTLNVPTGVDGDEVAAETSLITKISTQPSLNMLAYYNDPNFGGTGPLPPVVSQETTYTIHWKLINPGNDISGATVRGVLPPGITWKNIVSSGTGQPQPTYDRNRSEVVWNIGSLPFGAGTSAGNRYEATFQISLAPSQTQRGTTPVLIKNVSFSGTDAFTKQNIVSTAPDVTTGSLVDRPSEGVVQ
jgi:hypothetical protein